MKSIGARAWLVLGVVALLVVGVITVIGAVKATPTWKIGLEAPLSGSQASIGQGMLKGAQLAASEINTAGGLDGKNIQIVAIDDQADAAKGMSAAKAAIAAHLDGIVGPYNSGVGTTTLPLYIKAGLVPVRLTSASATEGMGVTLQPMESQIAPVAASTLRGTTSVAIAYDSTSEYTKGVAASVKAQLLAQGTTVTDFVALEPGKKNYDDVIAGLSAKSPQTIYAAVYYPEGALFAKELNSLGAKPSCLLDYASYDTGYVADAGSAATRCLVLGVPAPSDFAGARSEVAAYRAAFGDNPGTWSPYTYDSVKLLIATAAKNHGFAAAGLKQQFAGISGWRGWTGAVSLASPSGNREPATVVLTEVSGGQLHEIGMGSLAGPSTKVTLSAQLSSIQTFLHQVGTATTYGVNHLVGTSSTGTAVDMLGNVNYTAGSGEFYGSITFTTSGGDTIGVEMNGAAVKHADGSTSFSAPLKVIGGSGALLRIAGSGLFTGSRSGALGSSVQSTFTLTLTGLPSSSGL